MLRAIVLSALSCLVGALPLAAQQESAGTQIVIGSKNFTESRLLGELMRLTLEAHTDYDVEHRSSLGGTKICFDALLSGEIDLYPEYTGTAWAIHLREEEKISDALRAFLHVQRRSRELFDLEWLQPFGLENSYAIAMRREHAAELGIRTLSDLSRHLDLRAAFSIEFVNREDGFAGLAQHYGIGGLDVRSLEHGLAYEAIASGAADLIDAYTTDAKLARYDLSVLADDRDFFPPYHAAPVVRRDLLERAPDVAGALERLAFVLPNERMVELNYAVEEEGRAFADVAREFLVGAGILAPEAAAPAQAAPTSFVAFFAQRWRTTLELAGQHLKLTLLAVLLASLIAIPVGLWITTRRTAERILLGLAGVIQTVPSLALLAFMIPLPWFGLSARSAIAALFLYALLPIMRNTFTGVRNVDPDLIDAARGMGLTQRQILWRIQLPLALRTIMAGIRTATVITIGVATLAAFIGAGGLGQPIVEGLYLNQTNLILAGAIPAAVLALAADALLGFIERRWTPRGLR